MRRYCDADRSVRVRDYRVVSLGAAERIRADLGRVAKEVTTKHMGADERYIEGIYERPVGQ